MDHVCLAVSRIVIIEDHGIVQYGYQQLIGQDPSLEVCGIASDEVAGLSLLKREQPDLAIVDLSLQSGNGLDLIFAATRNQPSLKVLVVSMHDEGLFARRTQKAGARGYVGKHHAADVLLSAIHQLIDGKLYFATSVTDDGMPTQSVLPQQATSELEILTNREVQVFEAIGQGRSTKQIAESMFLSPKTIDRHKENIKQKLGIENATQLVRHATQWLIGFSSPPEK